MIDFSNLFETLEVDSDPLAAKKPVKSKTEPSLKNIVDCILEGSTVQSGPWIAGGMGRQLAIGETKFNDVDVWFSNQLQMDQLTRKLFDTFAADIYESFNSNNALTLQVGDQKVQLIKKEFYPSVNHVFDRFDFTCCQVGVLQDLSIYGPGVDDAKSRELRVSRLDPRAFIARYAKYIGYGYVMNPDKFIEILENEELNYEFDGSTLDY